MASRASDAGIGWLSIVRLGLVQAAIGAMVMVATSMLNRVMVVEYGVVAAIPAGLVAWHYAVQLTRPIWGHRSDRSARRTPWIMMGLGIQALGTVIAVDATILIPQWYGPALVLAIVGFTLIGIGVGMAGTALLALIASRVSVARKPAAAALTWTMMIAGIVVAAGVSGKYLDPFAADRLAIVASMVVLCAFSIALLALRGLEARSLSVSAPRGEGDDASFGQVLAEIRADPRAWRFTWFVFISMVAYSIQDLVLEPFAGLVFDMTPGQSTQLAGLQHGGILMGMLIAGAGGTLHARRYGRNPTLWIVLGCTGSAVMLAGLALGALTGGAWPLTANIFCLGVANGVFAVAAVGAMLSMASDGRTAGEGARMGVWGAAQAIAFGTGGLLGALLLDLMRTMGADNAAFATVFAVEGVMFIAAALVAVGIRLRGASTPKGAFT
ncbi:BCD family MFS transporter [Sphingomonas sp. FW199]|uniref:BCD family MFS transporter n=1 Tax=Sphingomonas sp. FW199 TaxID=3400217 RepID=UPI003CED3D8D